MFHLGRYQVVREVGRGGMGVVYLGADPAIGRDVAIKTIRVVEHCTPGEASGLRERLLREARAAGNLSHPNIVAIHDVGQQGDLNYIVMEFVAGRTLEHDLTKGPCAVEESLRILADAAHALDYAHANGIVHRDVKPANIMIRTDGMVKLTDFGIAKLTRGETMTEPGVMVGSPEYLSPEQLQAQAVSGRSDQFSLAAVAYQLLTGHKPFEAETLAALFMQVLFADPAPPHAANPALSAGLAPVFARALSKNPGDRFNTCTEFVTALRAASSTAAATMARPSPVSSAIVLPQPTVPPAPALRRRFVNSTWFPAVIIATLLLAVYGVVRVVRYWQEDSLAWETIKDAAYLEMYEYYLNNYPYGRHAAEARDRIRRLQEEARAWRALETSRDIARLEAFLKQYPKGRFALEAKVRIEQAKLEIKPNSAPGETSESAPGSVWLSPTPGPAKPGGPAPEVFPSPFSPGTMRRNSGEGRFYAWIPPGSFYMGCVPTDKRCELDESRHFVVLTKGFWMARHAVTIMDYRRYADAKRVALPRVFPDEMSYPQQTHPMTEVTWEEAKAYCRSVGGRLPTEAEWERAMRSGQEHIGLEYDANGESYARGVGREVHQVAQLMPSPWQLFDVLGNVREWCADAYEPDYYERSPRQDPTGPPHRTDRVQRGSYAGDLKGVRFSARSHDNPKSRSANTGFRCVIDTLREP